MVRLCHFYSLGFNTSSFFLSFLLRPPLRGQKKMKYKEDKRKWRVDNHSLLWYGTHMWGFGNVSRLCVTAEAHTEAQGCHLPESGDRLSSEGTQIANANNELCFSLEHLVTSKSALSEHVCGKRPIQENKILLCVQIYCLWISSNNYKQYLTQRYYALALILMLYIHQLSSYSDSWWFVNISNI